MAKPTVAVRSIIDAMAETLLYLSDGADKYNQIMELCNGFQIHLNNYIRRRRKKNLSTLTIAKTVDLVNDYLETALKQPSTLVYAKSLCKWCIRHPDFTTLFKIKLSECATLSERYEGITFSVVHLK